MSSNQWITLVLHSTLVPGAHTSSHDRLFLPQEQAGGTSQLARKRCAVSSDANSTSRREKRESAEVVPEPSPRRPICKCALFLLGPLDWFIRRPNHAMRLRAMSSPKLLGSINCLHMSAWRSLLKDQQIDTPRYTIANVVRAKRPSAASARASFAIQLGTTAQKVAEIPAVAVQSSRGELLASAFTTTSL